MCRRCLIRRGRLHHTIVRLILTLHTYPDHVQNSVLDAPPMIPLRDRRRGFVDPGMLAQRMRLPCNLVLPRWVRDDLLVLEHEHVVLEQLVVCHGATQSGFLGAVGPVRIFAVLEVELDLFETLFTHEFVTFFAAAAAQREVAPVNDGVDEAVWVGFELAAAGDAADALEAEGVPDAAGRDVRLVHEVAVM